MLNRRKFITSSIFASLGLSAFSGTGRVLPIPAPEKKIRNKKPIIISTWNHGIEANKAAMQTLMNGKTALDAVEAGVRVTEADPNNTSVGYGGFPDRDGNVTLDASIMDSKGNCGAVSYLQHIKHPISVARKIMEDTPHVMLSGEGALKFALENGFKKENLLTPNSEKAWKKWLETAVYKPVVNSENHDTIGMLASDMSGDLSGACTTSGLAFKMGGRVGDSPIIGAGLFVDNQVGAAVATGMGELVMKTLGAFLVVEFMNQGKSAQEACELAIIRISEKVPGYEEFQIGLLAMDVSGEIGAYAIHPGFNYALFKDGVNQMINSQSLLKK
jgi:isoaspartyl peptidase/L-asparaginase-like protein (Ntn-hydrolase superfamily)